MIEHGPRHVSPAPPGRILRRKTHETIGKIDSDLVKHSLNSPLTSKNNFIKVSSRSFSTTSKPQESSICSTNATDLLNLSPGWVTGFSDGECSFHVVVRKDNTYKSG